MFCFLKVRDADFNKLRYLAYNDITSLEDTGDDRDSGEKFKFSFSVLFNETQWDWGRPAVFEVVKTPQYLICHVK